MASRITFEREFMVVNVETDDGQEFLITFDPDETERHEVLQATHQWVEKGLLDWRQYDFLVEQIFLADGTEWVYEDIDEDFDGYEDLDDDDFELGEPI